jgi:dTDP-L-rhamnose 4-epimerase
LEEPSADQMILNVGSGNSYTITEIARCAAEALGRPEIEPQTTRKYRVGDIRHCFADISQARRVLRFEPQVSLSAGLRELAAHLDGQHAEDLVAQAAAELAARGLTMQSSEKRQTGIA